MALAEDYLLRRQGVAFSQPESGNWHPELLDNVAPGICSGPMIPGPLTMCVSIRRRCRPYQVWRHTIGTRHRKMNWYGEEKDDTFMSAQYKTITSQHYVVIHLASATTQRSAIT